jgi:hypothetical protein
MKETYAIWILCRLAFLVVELMVFVHLLVQVQMNDSKIDVASQNAIGLWFLQTNHSPE